MLDATGQSITVFVNSSVLMPVCVASKIPTAAAIGHRLDERDALPGGAFIPGG